LIGRSARRARLSLGSTRGKKTIVTIQFIPSFAIPRRWPSLSLPLSRSNQGDATYIIVKDDGSIADFGLNAVCTHLGCVVPWNKAENKFKCPCHGSQYNDEGKVIRGPAPLSLALAHAAINDSDTVIFSPWTETDFRTGLQPWWK
jgi:cytochrome b6-f complex iron-sulfur subunit